VLAELGAVATFIPWTTADINGIAVG